MLTCNQKVILSCLIRSDIITDTLKLKVFSYLYYQLCWDFDYFGICFDIESGVVDYNNYDFEIIQNPCPVGDKTDIKEV